MELQGIKMAVLGDSITEGVGVADGDNIYYNRVKHQCGLGDMYVDGIGGTRFARQRVPSVEPRHDLDFLSRIDRIDEDCDLIIIFGGTNDFGHGDAPIGSADDYTPDTFWGACNMICEKLLIRFPKSQIVFMGPLHRLNEDNPYGDNKPEKVATLYEYCDILRKVTKRYSMPDSVFIQAHPMRDGMKLFDPSLLDGMEVFNLHPNHNSKVGIASVYAYENNIPIIIAGSDFHHPNRNHEGVAALRGAYLPGDSFELAELLKKGDYLLEIGRNNLIIP